jgi:glyoxylase-like metal-dependent hydrolase (beta-lactamase superfamily II)
MANPSREFGPYEVILLFDGPLAVPSEGITHADGPEARRRVIERLGPTVTMDVNHFALRGPNGISLVDAGTGTEWTPSLGRAREAMQASGILPEAIDRVLLTHLHFDHAQGLLIGDDAYFPRAEVWVPEADLRFFTDGAARDALPESRRNGFYLTDRILRAYGKRLRPIPHGVVMPGVETVPLPGHTPGQAGYLLRGAGDAILFWGDVLHLDAEQPADPKIGFVFDLDAETALATRRRMLERAADEGWAIGGGHLSGFGRVRRRGEAFEVVQA